MSKRLNKCYCGCGQAPGVTCRLRLAECDVCGVKVRMTRLVLEQVQLSCSCGGMIVPVCLEDRARAGDHDAEMELSNRVRVSEIAAGAGRRSGEVRAARRRAAAMSPDELAQVAVHNSAAAAVFSPSAVIAASEGLPF